MLTLEGLPIPTDATARRTEVIERWNEGYRATVTFANHYGHLRVNQETVFQDTRVGLWVRNRRAEYKRQVLSPEH